MLQVFHINVANVDRDVAYVVMVIHICCKRMSLMFHQFFQTYVASVFISMLHMFSQTCVFYLDIVYVCNGFQVFLQVFETHVSSVSSTFRRMMQALHLNVANICFKCFRGMLQVFL
jgi:hypothetical protein